MDYCSEENRDEMLVHRQQITEDLKKYMQTQGYSLNPQSKSRHSLDSFVFTYINLGGMRDNVKVEINYSLRSHLFELEDRPVLSDVVHMEHLITVLQPVELFAAKISALFSRAAARDLYDTYNMINLGELEKIKTCVKEFLSGLMILTVDEEDFLRKFREREYIPGLLFTDDQVIRRISNHPMALWKIQEH